MNFGRYQAAIVVVALVLVTLVALVALGAGELVERWVGRVAAVGGPLLVAWLTRDHDGDGSPDIVDSDPDNPEVR